MIGKRVSRAQGTDAGKAPCISSLPQILSPKAKFTIANPGLWLTSAGAAENLRHESEGPMITPDLRCAPHPVRPLPMLPR